MCSSERERIVIHLKLIAGDRVVTDREKKGQPYLIEIGTNRTDCPKKDRPGWEPKLQC